MTDQGDFLNALRRQYADRDERDRPDWLTEQVHADGSVRVRMLTFDDIVEWANSMGEVE